MEAVDPLPGDLVIIIDSGGGITSSGDQMIAAVEAQKKKGVKVVCVANNNAASMAFNLLTHCSVRLATSGTKMLVHKIETFDVRGRKTAANLRREAARLDRDDEKYRRPNAAAMGLTLSEYDICADNETEWSAEKLYERGYLHGIAKIE